MNFDIVNLCPSSGLTMGSWGFGIALYPKFKTQVALSKLTSEQAHTAIDNFGRGWLDGCGYNNIFEYEGKESPLFKPNRDLFVTWGEWGLEHITVPGDACGLDIMEGIRAPRGGKFLGPHNIDTMAQAMLLLVVFTWFAESISLLSKRKQ